MSDELLANDYTEMDGSDITISTNVADRKGRHLWQYVNETDVDITIAVYGTRVEDSSFEDVVELDGSPTSVSSNDVNAGYLDEPWEIVRFVISFSGNPTEGSFEVHEMTEV